MKKGNQKEVVDLSTLPEVNTAISSIIFNFKTNDKRLRIIEAMYKQPDKILKIISRENIIEFAKEQKIFVDPNEGKKVNPKDAPIEKKIITPDELAKAAKGLIIETSLQYRKDKKALMEQIEQLKQQKEEAIAYWSNPPPQDPKKKPDKKNVPPNPEEIVIPVIDEFDTDFLVVLYNYPLNQNEFDALDKENIIIHNITLVNEGEDYPEDKSYEESQANQLNDPKAKKPAPGKSASADLNKPITDNAILKYFAFPPNNMVTGFSNEELQNPNFGSALYNSLNKSRLESDKTSKMRITLFDKEDFHFRMMDDPRKTYYNVYQDNYVEKLKKIYKFYLYYLIWQKNNHFQELGTDPKIFTKKNVDTLLSLSVYEPKDYEHLSMGNILLSFFNVYDPKLILINDEEEERKRLEEIRKKEEEEALKKAKEEEEKRLAAEQALAAKKGAPPKGKKPPVAPVVEEKPEEKKEEEDEAQKELTEEEIKMDNDINQLFQDAENDLEEEYQAKPLDKQALNETGGTKKEAEMLNMAMNNNDTGNQNYEDNEINIENENEGMENNMNTGSENIKVEENDQGHDEEDQNEHYENPNVNPNLINNNANEEMNMENYEEQDENYNEEQHPEMAYDNMAQDMGANNNMNSQNMQNNEEYNEEEQKLQDVNQMENNNMTEHNQQPVNQNVDQLNPEEQEITPEPVEGISTLPYDTSANLDYERLIINENDDFMKHSIDAKSEDCYLFSVEKNLNLYRNIPGIYRDLNLIHPIQENLRKAERSKVYPFLPEEISIPIYEKYELIHKFEEEMIDEFPLRETQLNFGNRKYQENLNKDILSQKISKLLMLDPEIKTYYNNSTDNVLLMLYYNIPENRVYRKLKTMNYLSKPDFENWVNYFRPVFDKKMMEKKLEAEAENQNPEGGENQANNADKADAHNVNPEENNENPEEGENKESAEQALQKQKLKEQNKLFAELEKSLDSSSMYIANDTLIGQIKEKIKYMFPSDNGIFIKKIIENGYFHSFSSYVYKDDMIFGIRNLKNDLCKITDNKNILSNREFWFRYNNDTNLTVNYLEIKEEQKVPKAENENVTEDNKNQNPENPENNANEPVTEPIILNKTYITLSLVNGLNIQILPNGEIAQKLINSSEYRIVNSKASVIRCFADGVRNILYSNGNFSIVNENKATNINNRGMKIERNLETGEIKELEPIPITIQTDTDSETKTLIREDGVLLIKYSNNTSLTIHNDETKIFTYEKDKNGNIHYVIEHNLYATINVYLVGENKLFENDPILTDLAKESFDNIIYHINLPDGNNVYVIKKKGISIIKEKVVNANANENVQKEENATNQQGSPKSSVNVTSVLNSPENNNVEPQETYIEREVEEVKTVTYIYNYDGGMFRILPGDIEIISPCEKRNLMNENILQEQLNIDDPYSRSSGIYSCVLNEGKIITVDNENNKFELFDDGYANCELYKSVVSNQNNTNQNEEQKKEEENKDLLQSAKKEEPHNEQQNEEKKETEEHPAAASPQKDHQGQVVQQAEDINKKPTLAKKKKDEINLEEEKITYDQKGRPCSPSYEKIELYKIEEKKKREEEKRLKKELEEKIAKEKAAEAERAKKPGAKNAAGKKGKNDPKKGPAGKGKKQAVVEEPEEEEDIVEEVIPPTPPTQNFIFPRLFVIENDSSGYELLNEEQIKTYKNIKEIDDKHVKYTVENINKDFVSHYYVTKYVSIKEGIQETHKINKIQLPEKLAKFAKIPSDPIYPHNEFYLIRNFIETREFNESFPDELLYEELPPKKVEGEENNEENEGVEKKKRRRKKKDAPKTFREKVQEAKQKSNEYFEGKKSEFFFGKYGAYCDKEKQQPEIDKYRKFTREILLRRQTPDIKFDYDKIRKKIQIKNNYIQILPNQSVLFDIKSHVEEKERKKIREDLSFRIYHLELKGVKEEEKNAIINEYDTNRNDSLTASMLSRKKHLIEGQNKEPKFFENYFESDKGIDFLATHPHVNKVLPKNMDMTNQNLQGTQDQQGEINEMNEEEKNNYDSARNMKNVDAQNPNNEFSGGENTNMENNFDMSNKRNSPVVLINGENDQMVGSNMNMNQINFQTKTKKPKKQLPSIHKQTQILNKINEEYNAQKAKEWCEAKTMKYTVEGDLRQSNPKIPKYLKPTFPQAEFNEDYIYIEKLTERRVKTSSVANRIYFNAPSVEEIRRSGQHDLLLEAMEKRRTPEEMMERLNLMITSELCDPLNKQLKIEPVALDFGIVAENKMYQMFFKLRNDDNMTNRVSIRKRVPNLSIESFLGGKVVPGETKKVKVVLDTHELTGKFSDIVEIYTKSFIYKIPIKALIVKEEEFDKSKFAKEGRFEYTKCYPVVDEKNKCDPVKLVLPRIKELENEKNKKLGVSTSGTKNLNFSNGEMEEADEEDANESRLPKV